MDTKLRRIAGLDLFAGCRSHELGRLARMADEVVVPAGTVLATAGAPVREFVVVLDGAAGADGGGVFSSGAHYGEIGLVSGEPHRETIHALTDVRLLVFEARAFRGVLERFPSVSRKLMRELIGRLRDTPSAA